MADTMSVRQSGAAGAGDTVCFDSAGGGGGAMRLTWQDGLIAGLEITFGG